MLSPLPLPPVLTTHIPPNRFCANATKFHAYMFDATAHLIFQDFREQIAQISMNVWPRRALVTMTAFVKILKEASIAHVSLPTLGRHARTFFTVQAKLCARTEAHVQKQA